MPAAICLFAYARPQHTRRTLDSLAANILARESDLIIFSDAARTPSQARDVAMVREVVHAASGFKSVRIVERAENFGLARNIIEGITEACGNHERVIVVEDDIVSSPMFLGFMNDALEKYKDEPRVWHVSGWNYPMPVDGLGDAYFWRVMNCWGWATWSDRWRHFRKDPTDLIKRWSRSDIKAFNVDGSHDFWAQVLSNNQGVLDTWAVFWYATIFKNGGLCLTPAVPYVENIGQDGSGQNCGYSESPEQNALASGLVALPTHVIESEAAIRRLQSHLDRSPRRFFGRRGRALMRLLFGKEDAR